jgi:hypothetical protein
MNIFFIANNTNVKKLLQIFICSDQNTLMDDGALAKNKFYFSLFTKNLFIHEKHPKNLFYMQK